MKYDFGGWATRNDLQCADGRVIKKDAFKGQKLYDNGYRTYGDVLDSSDAPITDSNLDTVIGRTYSSDLLRDSNGDVIEGRAIFVIK